MLEIVAYIAPVAIVLGLSFYVLFVAVRRAWSDDRPLLLGLMLRRHGLDELTAASRGQAHELARAARRCFGCPVQRGCVEWLDSGRRTGYLEFCPNADFIERVKHAVAG